MGMRSIVESCDLEVNNLNLFLNIILSEKVGSDPKFKYLWDSIRITDGEIYVDWDDWKIQGYWYESFCAFLNKLQQSGLRGSVELIYEEGDHYTITFNENRVEVVMEKDTYLITDNGLKEI